MASEDRFQELKQKYVKVLNVINKEDLKHRKNACRKRQVIHPGEGAIR